MKRQSSKTCVDIIDNLSVSCKAVEILIVLMYVLLEVQELANLFQHASNSHGQRYSLIKRKQAIAVAKLQLAEQTLKGTKKQYRSLGCEQAYLSWEKVKEKQELLLSGRVPEVNVFQYLSHRRESEKEVPVLYSTLITFLQRCYSPPGICFSHQESQIRSTV